MTDDERAAFWLASWQRDHGPLKDLTPWQRWLVTCGLLDLRPAPLWVTPWSSWALPHDTLRHHPSWQNWGVQPRVLRRRPPRNPFGGRDVRRRGE
jgi:hypothetical protein